MRPCRAAQHPCLQHPNDISSPSCINLLTLSYKVIPCLGIPTLEQAGNVRVRPGRTRTTSPADLAASFRNFERNSYIPGVAPSLSFYRVFFPSIFSELDNL